MHCTGIHHVTLIVDDRDKAAWFYGEVLELKEKTRPGFAFPGLFYHCGDQEIHLIVATRPLTRDDLQISVGRAEVSRKHIHRHAALITADHGRVVSRLESHAIAPLFSERQADLEDPLTRSMVDGWMKMYGAVPIFVHDPFENLLELVPAGQG